MNRYRWLALQMLIMLMAALLSGCGQSTTGNTATSAPAASANAAAATEGPTTAAGGTVATMMAATETTGAATTGTMAATETSGAGMTGATAATETSGAAMSGTTAATETTGAATTGTMTATETAGATTVAAPGGGNDLLAAVKQRGKLLISTDANYKPQSYKKPDGSWEGFDIDVGREIAKRLGVQAEFLDINFDIITAGSWNGRWDINIGSMTVTPGRKEKLFFTAPYYYTPASFAVHKDSTAKSIDDLNGKKVGFGSSTTYQDYLKGTLKLEGEQILRPPPQVQQQVYDTDQQALTDLALGNGTRLDAVLTALPTIQDSIKGGQPFKVLGDPVYYEDLAVALDQKSPQSSQGLRDAISKIVDDMHKDGTLTKLSNQYYGVDLTNKK